jgi:hypothetical protein
MRRSALAVAVLVLVACGQRPSFDPGELRPQDLTAAERQAFVYSAAIEHLVNTMPTRPRRIFVLDRVVGQPEKRPIPTEVQDRIREELALLPTLKFVSAPGEVVGPADQGARVQRGGVLIKLGPVPSGRDRVTVQAWRYKGNLGLTSQTLELKRYGLRWRVEGTAVFATS